jgi:hypothetical protein
MENTDNTCSVCSETYNKTKRCPVKCICDFTCCRDCIKQYIETKSEDVHCMSCKVKWTRDFMFKHFDKKYLSNDYRIYRENILYEKEIGLLPMTQPYVENILKCEDVKIELKQMEDELRKLENNHHAKLSELILLQNRQSSSTLERRKYVRKCPNNDCHGFLSSQLKCELCQCWVCSECREIKGQDRNAEHTCNPEILESVKLMEQDTKPCPNCTALIYKIIGCNQMFCTECHTPFDWKTLRIIDQGVIHNPHYFEWQRRQNQGIMERNPNDILCGREIDHDFVSILRQRHVEDFNRRFEYISKLELLEEFNTIENQLFTLIKDMRNYKTYLQSIYVKYKENLYQFAYRCFQYIEKTTKDINYGVLAREIRSVLTQYNKKIMGLEDICRHIIHIHYIEVPRFRVENELDANRDLRIQFMMNKLSEDKMKIQIQKRDKKNQKNREIWNILRTFVSCSTDLLYRLNEHLDEYDTIIGEMHELRLYTNECLQSTFKVYGSLMNHFIDDRFQYV